MNNDVRSIMVYCAVQLLLCPEAGLVGGLPVKGPFKCYVTQMGVGGLRFSAKKCYEGVRFNVISVTRGWVGVQFPGKKALRNT